MDEKVIDSIVRELKEKISQKYSISEMRIFGSRARKDQAPESDLDIFILLAHWNREIEEELLDLAYEVELERDCLIDLIIIDDEALRGPYGQSPIFKTILQEGVVV